MPEGSFSYSVALDLLKSGHRVTRAKWEAQNLGGPYMKDVHGENYVPPFVVLMPALHLPPYNTQGTDRKVNDRTAKWIGEDKPLDCKPYFSYYESFTNAWRPGWNPSTEDQLAEDWRALA